MSQSFRILALFWGTAIAAELEYRINFVLAMLSSIGQMVGGIFGLFLFYRTGYTFQGWGWYEALLLFGMFTLMQGFAATLLAPNLNKIVRHVQDGTLDFILLKPISSQFWLSTRVISPWGVPDLLFGLGLIGYAASHLEIQWGMAVLSIIPLLLGFVILYSLWFMLGATSIWFVKIYNVTEVLRGLLESGRYPMSAYPAIYRVFFTFVIPIAFLTTVPAQVFLGSGQWSWIIGSAGLAVALLWGSQRFWQFALRFYTSASS